MCMDVHLSDQIVLGNIWKLEYRNTVRLEETTFWENTSPRQAFQVKHTTKEKNLTHTYRPPALLA